MNGGFGGMLSIRLSEGEARARDVAARVQVFKRATSLGSVESLIEHRASVEGPGSRCPTDLLRLGDWVALIGKSRPHSSRSRSEGEFDIGVEDHPANKQYCHKFEQFCEVGCHAVLFKSWVLGEPIYNPTAEARRGIAPDRADRRDATDIRSFVLGLAAEALMHPCFFEGDSRIRQHHRLSGYCRGPGRETDKSNSDKAYR
jgi:hypothetical protein